MILCGNVAQLVAQDPDAVKVGGSSPSIPTISMYIIIGFIQSNVLDLKNLEHITNVCDKSFKIIPRNWCNYKVMNYTI